MTQLLNDFLSGSAAWGVLLTLAAFALGTLINKVTGKAIFNPLLLGSIFVIIFLSVCNIPYADYKASAAPVNYLLLPATVALAIPLYEKIDLLKENAAAIIAGISVGTLVSLGSALALALALDLTREQYATLLPKSVTTAISMDVAAELGGIAALTGAIVIVTGIVGALLAETVCKMFHITDPIAKGVGIGTSAHAVGTSKAMQMGEVEVYLIFSLRLFLYAAVFPFILQDGRHALHGAYCTMQFFVAKLCTQAGVTALHERALLRHQLHSLAGKLHIGAACFTVGLPCHKALVLQLFNGLGKLCHLQAHHGSKVSQINLTVRVLFGLHLDVI